MINGPLLKKRGRQAVRSLLKYDSRERKMKRWFDRSRIEWHNGG